MKYIRTIGIIALAFPWLAIATTAAADTVVGFPWDRVAEAALTVLVGLLAWGIRSLTKWLAEDKGLKFASRLGLEAERAVLAAEQEVRPTLSAAAKDGKLSSTEAKLIKTKVVNAVLASIGVKKAAAHFGSEAKAKEEIGRAVEASVQSLNLAKAARGKAGS